MSVSARSTADIQRALGRLEEDGIIDLKSPLRQSIPSMAAAIESARLSVQSDGQQDYWWIFVGGDGSIFFEVGWDW